MIQFVADKTRLKKQVDVTVKLSDYVTQLSPEEQAQVFRHYKISHVHFHIDYEIGRAPEGERMRASMKGDYEFTWIGDQLLRENVLIRNCPIQPGDKYNEVRVERAYSNLNQLAPIKYVDISFDPISEDELDCHIVLSRSKLNSISIQRR